MKDQHKLIDDYVRDLLSEKDKATFELAIAKDEALQREVKFRKSIVNHYKFEEVKQTIEKARIENEQEAELEPKLEIVRDTIAQARIENIQSRERRMRLYKNIALAAVFSVLIGVGWFSNIFHQEGLLVDITIDEADLQTVTAFNLNELKILIDKANNAIKATDFASVLSITDQLRKAEGFETDEILQNECYIYYKQKNYTKAARQVEGIQNLELQNEVRWKLSKLYLKVGEKDLAKKQLLKIQVGAYKNKAAKKLEKLN